MDYKTACEVLQLSHPFERDELKQQYRLNALRYHPDKNADSLDATKKFQEINEAYTYLLKSKESPYSFFEEEFHDDNGDLDENIADNDNYKGILFSFIKNIFENDNVLLASIINKITSICEPKAIDVLKKIDRKILIKIYEFIKLYRDAFYFSDDFFVVVENLVKSKCDNDECIILHPMIDDLWDNNLYKMTIDEIKYIIPLWHDELVYEHHSNDGKEIYFKCYPILPDNMSIDSQNNLHVDLSYDIDELLNKEFVDVEIGKKTVRFFVDSLKIKREQTLILKKEGISRMNTIDIYDVSRNADIYLHIQLQ